MTGLALCLPFAALRLFGKLDPRRCYLQKLTGLSVIAASAMQSRACC
jgi:hypothetical protein